MYRLIVARGVYIQLTAGVKLHVNAGKEHKPKLAPRGDGFKGSDVGVDRCPWMEVGVVGGWTL
jgi:hypothetical protein